MFTHTTGMSHLKVIGVADSVVTPTNRCVHNKVGSNVKDFDFKATNTKRAGLD